MKSDQTTTPQTLLRMFILSGCGNIDDLTSSVDGIYCAHPLPNVTTKTPGSELNPALSPPARCRSRPSLLSSHMPEFDLRSFCDHFFLRTKRLLPSFLLSSLSLSLSFLPLLPLSLTPLFQTDLTRATFRRRRRPLTD